ncbi:MAG: hypothetical protein QXF11_02995 [Candidatus Hadarchaeales archaeon]
METLVDFFTSKLALGVFSSAMFCLAILFIGSIDKKAKSEQMMLNAELITNTVQRVAVSPWDYKVRLSFLDRQPATFVFYGESSPYGQLFVVEDAEHPEYRRFLQIQCIINNGLFEIVAKNPAFVVLEKRNYSILLETAYAFDSD